MKELIEALTDFLKEATVYLGRQNGKASPNLNITPAPSLAADIPATRRTRKPKDEPAAAPAPAAAAAAPMPEGLETAPAAPVVPPAVPPAAVAAEGEIPEGKSLAALYEAGAKVVERFKNSKPTGFERATKHMTETYKVARMQDLPHAQRLQFIGWLKTELEKPA